MNVGIQITRKFHFREALRCLCRIPEKEYVNGLNSGTYMDLRKLHSDERSTGATNDGPDGTAVDIFKTFEISENQDLEDCHYVVTVAVVAASLLAGLAAAPKSMQG